MISTKANSATDLHVAHVGRAAFQIQSSQIDGMKVTGRDLVRRYGMWAARCISLNAQTAAAVPFKLLRVERNETTRKDLIRWRDGFRAPTKKELAYLRGRMSVQPSQSVMKRVRGNMDNLVVIDEHPVLDLMNDINPWTDGYAYRECRYSDLQIHGVAYSLIVDGRGGMPVELWRMLPHKTKVLKDPVRFVSGFEVGEGTDVQRYDAEEVLWYRLFDPMDPWGGVGPTEAWLKTIDSSFQIQEFQHELMTRFGSPDYVVVSKHPMKREQKEAFRRDWRRLFGRMFGRRENVGFLSGETTLEKIGQTNRELEFSQSAKDVRDAIGQAYGVPKAMLTTDDVNRANARETRQMHMETTIWPMIQRVEDVDNERLIPRMGEGIFLMHENPIQEDETIRIQERASRLQSGWSINEIRTEEGEEPLDGPDGDEPLIGAGLVPLSRLAAEEPVGESADSQSPDIDPAMDVDGAKPPQVLAGQQITAAAAIIQAVIDEKIPIESARGQLQVMFNLEPAQVELMLAGVENFEKPEPQMPMMLPPGGQPPARNEPPQAEQEPAEPTDRRSTLPDGLKMQLLFEMLSSSIGRAVKSAIPWPSGFSNHTPDITVPIELRPEIKLGDMSITQPPIYITNDVKHPDVNVEPAEIYVVNDVKQPDVLPPAVSIEPAKVEVNIEPPAIRIPDFKANVHATIPEMPPTIVNVEAPKVEPKIIVNPLLDLPPDDD